MSPPSDLPRWVQLDVDLAGACREAATRMDAGPADPLVPALLAIAERYERGLLAHPLYVCLGCGTFSNAIRHRVADDDECGPVLPAIGLIPRATP